MEWEPLYDRLVNALGDRYSEPELKVMAIQAAEALSEPAKPPEPAQDGKSDVLIDGWFALRDLLLINGQTPTGARPPSLRDACYAYALSLRGYQRCEPQTIEAFVNGLELGTIDLLRKVWNERF